MHPSAIGLGRAGARSDLQHYEHGVGVKIRDGVWNSTVDTPGGVEL